MAAKKTEKKRRSGVVRGILSFVVICAALSFGMAVFFRISEINVTGCDVYSPQEIIEASGLKEGGSLILLNRKVTEERIYEKLVLVGKVKVSRKLPDGVSIQVCESGPVALMQTDEGAWLVDRMCRAMEPAVSGDESGYVSILGLEAVSPEIGQAVSTTPEDMPRIEYMAEILGSMWELQMLNDVSSIDMSNISNPSFEYQGRFKVKLGSMDNTGYKLKLLQNAVLRLKPEKKGVFDISQKKEAHFIPDP